MNLNLFMKKLAVLSVSGLMILGNASPASYQVNAEDSNDAPATQDVTWEKVEDSSVKLLEPAKIVEEDLEEAGLIKDGNVRVSIVVDGNSTIDAGYSVQSVATNSGAQAYRAQVLNNQKALEAKISAEALGGRALDVVWNITLAGNMISAYVPYARINDIKKVEGVKDVVIEAQYDAPETVVGDDPNMMISTDMTGTSLISSEYSGAGQAVAVIDTGTDLDHQSFNPEAFEYSISQLDKEVDLITLDDVKAVFSQLNASRRMNGITAEDVYRSAKVPFAYNYVDNNLNVLHLSDTQEEHGSHVAGIVTANKYLKTGEDKFELAADTVKMFGQAPDAQLLVMKVFGARGGAYDSDYMVAIEDAMVLGAASANLSLGSSNAGITTSASYASTLNKFTEEDTVVTISMGNSYAWSTYTPLGYLYSEDANLDTGGSPGSFTNSFTVASMENDGVVGKPIKVGDSAIFYGDGSSANNQPFVTLAGEHGYIAIDGVGTDEDMAALKDVLGGKIAVVSRGETSFYQKANAAVANGAIGTLIYNNQAGTISMSLSGYSYTAPAASITAADGALMKKLGEKKTTDAGAVYYEGTLTVTSDYEAAKANSEYLLMSDFSSWGATGDLNIKPEITAPGGNIFSVFGTNRTTTGTIAGGVDQYELMSGTSMACPQITGLDAVIHQYIEENDLVEKTGLTKRQLTLSLLMSTAQPVIEEGSDYYYSILKVGSGLANVAAATSAKSFIEIEGTTVNGKPVEKAAYTTSYADKKVKAMLGEDAERSGKYTVTFDVTNFSDEDAAYTFGGDIFTQDIFSYQGVEYLDEWTVPLNAVVNFTVDGEPLEAEDGADLDFNGDKVFNAYDAVALLEYVVGTRAEITDADKADIDEDGDIDTYDAYLALDLYREAEVIAEAGQTLTVTAEIDLNGSLDELGSEERHGNYVEGYLYVTEADTDEGVAGVEHSIPVLGYFGSWSEPEMTDKGSRLEYEYGTETRAPYMSAQLGNNAKNVEYFGLRYAGDTTTYVFGGNPFTTDETYHPERNAINSADTLYNVAYSLTRNSMGGRLTVEDANGKVLSQTQPAGTQYAPYYVASNGAWSGTSSSTSLSYRPTAEEGTELVIKYTMAPEYYLEGGAIQWDALHENATISTQATVDNTAPELVGDEAVKLIEDEEGNITALEVTVKDNQYIAAVALGTEAGALVNAYYAEEDAEAGETKTYTFELGENVAPHLYVAAYDYAANETVYRLNLNAEELANDLTVDIVEDEIVVLVGTSDRGTVEVGPWGADASVTWSIADETIATVDETGLITGVKEGSTTVTAAAKSNPEVTDTATVTVKSFDIDLNAIIWDEEGVINFAEFNTNALPEYTRLSDSVGAELASATYDKDGTLYVASTDSSDGTSVLYTVDEETFELTEIGTDPDGIGYFDIAKTEILPENYLLGVYGTYILTVDKNTGAYDGAWDLSRYTGNNELVGITYQGIVNEARYGDTDWYFAVDESGALWSLGFRMNNGNATMYSRTRLGYIADPIDMDYFQSLYYDGENVYWSRFNYADNKVELVMVEDIQNTGYVWSVGYFADGVWPVGGLYTAGLKDIGKAAISADTADVEDVAAARIAVKASKYNKASKGSLNVAADTAENVRETAVKNGAGASNATIVDVTTDTEATNGLYTVSYDPEAVELVATKGVTRYNAINDAEAGEVKVGFINPEALEEGTVVAELVFKAIDPTVTSEVEIGTDEENNDKSEESEIVEIGSDAVVLTGDIRVNVTGDDWGPGIDKVIVKLDKAVDGAYITGDLFEVTQAANNGDPQARTVLDAYVSDADGNKVSGESEYVTIDLRITPLEGNPIVWSMQTWTNSWANPLVVDVNLKDGAKLFAGDETVTYLDIDGNIDIVTPDSEDVIFPQLEGYEFDFYQAADGLNIPYGFYTPENADDGNKHALVIWNHGVGERGMDARIALLGNEVTALSSDEFQDLFDGAYVFVPQSPSQGRGNYISGVIEMIEKYIADESLNIDADRVIVGGCSMGGGNTMSLIFTRPDLFAAAYPICPASSASGATEEQINAIARLPIWFTHCVADDTVAFENSSPRFVERLQAAGNTNVHWSYYEDVHDTTGRFNDLTEDGSDYQYATHWSWVYFDNNYNYCDDEDCDNLNEWEWLAAQTRAPFQFDDVQDPDKYYYDPVYWAYNHDPQITTGTSAFTFSPEEDVTRGQFVTFLYRAAGEPEVGDVELAFTDVDENAFYAKAVAWAVENDITTGTSATTFAPNDAVTRAQIVTFLYRYAGEPEADTSAIPFTDVKATAYYAAPVAWAVENNITTGTSATKFSPNKNCTRGQAVTFLYRAVGE